MKQVIKILLTVSFFIGFWLDCNAVNPNSALKSDSDYLYLDRVDFWLNDFRPVMFNELITLLKEKYDSTPEEDYLFIEFVNTEVEHVKTCRVIQWPKKFLKLGSPETLGTFGYTFINGYVAILSNRTDYPFVIPKNGRPRAFPRVKESDGDYVCCGTKKFWEFPIRFKNPNLTKKLSIATLGTLSLSEGIA